MNSPKHLLGWQEKDWWLPPRSCLSQFPKISVFTGNLLAHLNFIQRSPDLYFAFLSSTHPQQDVSKTPVTLGSIKSVLTHNALPQTTPAPRPCVAACGPVWPDLPRCTESRRAEMREGGRRCTAPGRVLSTAPRELSQLACLLCAIWAPGWALCTCPTPYTS